jgi:Fe-S-cluster containining protein
MDDRLDELERQVECGSQFTHTVLTEQAERANETDALVNGLVDLLITGGMINADKLRQAVEAVRDETAAAGELATVGVLIRVDGEQAGEPAVVDCAARLPVCQAVCCRLQFALSVEEIESGPLRWDLGRPYLNRRDPDGYCHECDPGSRTCGVYEQRPAVCRRYSCEGDGRIWKDFDAMELNQEWIDANLGGERPGPVESYMDAYAQTSARARAP